ncbi:hypothetical protein [Paenibacillus roseipurpureus]|uniref:Uncharacterized protein n=1 Tax=Paenibacillus roseopurpureus TaxID=2918901 RepID=A0AA96LT90_9BACL|nr:hypothetical protein [Paenibacillus sp. MBLB1832]WNR45669.1 hypothetical protein MJB10_06090 [Paenibacillus sp. MBLB1832]
MKKKYIALLIFMAIFAVAVNQDWQKGHQHEFEQDQTQAQTPVPSNLRLTMADVQAAFVQAGSPLEAWPHEMTFYTLNGIAPTFYQSAGGRFAIYVFMSDEDRVKGREDFDEQTATAKVALSHIYEIRNVLIFELKQVERVAFMQKVKDSLNGSNMLAVLTIENVKAALQQQGVVLDSADFYYDWFKLGLKKEFSFNLNAKEQLYVYIFDSATDVDRGLEQINNQNAMYDIAHMPMSYRVSNMLMIYMRYKPMAGIEEKIQSAVDALENFNNGAILTKEQAIRIALDYAGTTNHFKWIATEPVRGEGYWEVILGSDQNLDGQHHPPEKMWMKVKVPSGKVYDVRQSE